MQRTLHTTLAVLAALAVISGCAPSPAEEATPITVAYAPFESVGLLFVAEDQGFFAANGLAVTYREYPTGVGALDAAMAGDADIAVGAAEFPLVTKAFQGARVSAIATIDRPDFIYLIGRKDRGIQGPADVRGRRIGTVAGSSAQFYLGRFLELNGMTMADVTFVDVRTPEEWRAAIANGDLDAVVLAQPEASLVSETLGANATFFSVQGSQPSYALAISANEWIAAHPELVERFLSALAEAETFMAEHPAEASAIVQERLGLDTEYMKLVREHNNFALSLDESLILAMEDEARWMIRSNLTTETVIPDFVDYVSVEGLEAVRPGSVSIVR